MDSTQPASSNHAKGEIKILSLSEAEIKKCIDLRKLLDALADGFKALSDGRVVNPARPQLDIPKAGYSLAMPAWMKGMHLTVKLVNAKAISPGASQVTSQQYISSIQKQECLFALWMAPTSRPYARLARPSSRCENSPGAMPRSRPSWALAFKPASTFTCCHSFENFHEIRVFSKDFAEAQALASRHSGITAVDDLESAVRSSDVVCLATHSYVPVISAEWVQPGTHVSSVGVAPPGGELPVDLIARGNLFVETRDSFSPTPVGCCELANIDPEAGTDLGAMLLGQRPGRTSDEQITIYKAMGVAMEDMVAADLAYREAKRLGAGQPISL